LSAAQDTNHYTAAFFRFYGCYEALSSGLVSEAFMLLTGGFCWQKRLSAEAADTDNMFKQLRFVFQNSQKVFAFVNVDDSSTA